MTTPAIHPRLRLVAFGLALTVAGSFVMAAFSLGFYADDYVLAAFVEHRYPDSPPWWDLYRFVTGTPAVNVEALRTAAIPWWSAPALKLHFVRPLTSALFALDHTVFGASPFGYHLHSLLWAIALVATVGAFYRRFLPAGTATLAAILFAVDAGHTLVYAWISCRHVSVAAVFSLLGLLAFARDREEGWRPGRLWAAAGLGAGLLGGESAVGAFAYVAAYAILAASGAARESARAAVLRLSPSAAVAFGYAGLYLAMHGGAAHSAAYIDPLGDPMAYAATLVTRLPVYLGEATLGVPSEFSTIAPLWPLLLVAAAGVGLAVFLYRACAASVSEGERAALRWLVPGALGALACAVGGFPGGRVRLMADVGGAAFFAVLLQHAFDTGLGGGKAGTIGRRAVGGLFAALHLAVAPGALVANTKFNAAVARKLESAAMDAEVPDESRRVFLLAASDPMISIYSKVVFERFRPSHVGCWSTVSGARADHRLTRVDARTFRVEPIGTSLVRGAFETLYRSPDDPMHVGDEVSQCDATFRVDSAESGRPTGVSVRLDVPLEDPSLDFLVWDGDRLRRFALPAVGGSVVVPWRVGPMGLF